MRDNISTVDVRVRVKLLRGGKIGEVWAAYSKELVVLIWVSMKGGFDGDGDREIEIEIFSLGDGGG